MTELVGAVLTRPAVDAAAARTILRDSWGIEGELRPLPSERDRNFAVVVDGHERFVLKISNSTEDRGFLDLQHAVLDRLAAAGVPCQLATATAEGRDIVPVAINGSSVLVRLLTWLPGRPLAAVPPETRQNALLEDLGRTMGRVVVALEGFDDPAAHRPFQWDATRGLAIVDGHAGAVVEPGRRALLESWRRRLDPLATVLRELPHGVIHNDANDHNVLVADDGRSVSGLLDLGDTVWSVAVNELAVAAAYAALAAPAPLEVIRAVRSGFEKVRPLSRDEGRAVLDLVALRLCTSVVLSAHQSRLAPDDPYLTISEAPAWSLLERLARETA